MSSTRRAKPGSAKPQEAFCSSIEYETGLLANVVALRCQVLTNAEERELVFALQYYSWQPGGLDKFAADLRDAHPAEIATLSMQKFGFKPGQVYNAERVRLVRQEMGICGFLLRGEVAEMPDGEWISLDGYEREQWLKKARSEARSHPTSYPAEQFAGLCRDAANNLADYLANICIDPKRAVAAPWYFPNLISVLQGFMRARGEAMRSRWAETEITRRVGKALDYALATGEMTPIYGDPRLGKSEAAKAWCAAHPGRARYVQVPAGNDDISLFRLVAEAYGVSSGLSLKSVQLRERIEKVARAAGLMIVFDEAQKLLGDAFRIYRRPSRITWVINQLVNCGVPVALVATDEFETEKQRIQKQTGWKWEQFDGRIGIPEILPKELSQDDLTAVARNWLPEGDAASIKALVGYALFTKSNIAGIKHVVVKARYEAGQQGREKLNLADIKSAIQARMPVDTANVVSPVLAKPVSERFTPLRSKRTVKLRGESVRAASLEVSGLQPGCRAGAGAEHLPVRIVEESTLASS